jgi:type VI secretion system secreted protein VgrG
MPTFSQEDRLIAIDTPLGKDILLLTGFNGVESVSALFEFQLNCVSENHSISFPDIIGQNVTITLLLAEGGERHFNGIISHFSQGRGGGESGTSDPRFSFYTARMVPWLWLLTQTADSRIFQDKTVSDIVDQVFTEKGFQDYSLRLQGDYEPLAYCVQYRETDFNFISRLLEEYGIFYFFEHEKGKHNLVITDTRDENKPCPTQSKARYQISGGGWLEEDVITALEFQQEIRPAKYFLRDFNFETPSAIEHESKSKEVLGPGEREIYDYHGRFMKRALAEHLANRRMEEEEAQITTIIGQSDCRAFTSGYRFKLMDYYRKDMNKKEFLLISVEHEVSQKSEYPGTISEIGEGELNYSNRFRCIPYDVPFRPRRIARKPVVQGTQTAIVTGPAGEEIHTDQYGRVKVQFHWDREGKKDENSSCWIRVSQTWAGGGWGAMFIPRIGHEVIVDFIEGDPDRPIITGRVYHGANMPPYGLPGEKTKSTLKSNSSKGGGGFNEIRLEDKKGDEEVFFHAQKDENTVVENDQTLWVGNDRAESIIRDRSLEVGRDKSELVKKDKAIQILGQHDEKITGDMNILVASNLTESVAINYSESVGAAMELTIGGLLAISVGGAMTESVGGAKNEIIGSAKSETIGGSLSLDVGSNVNETIGKSRTIRIMKDLEENVANNHRESVEKNFVLEAKKVQVIGKDEINIKTGKAQIIMKQNGDITIKGKKINIKGSGDVKIKGSKIKEN